MAVTSYDVLSFTGRPSTPDELDRAQAHIDVATAMVRGYTRGNGFTGDDYGDDLAAVIISTTARMVRNPHQVRSETVGAMGVTYGTVNGWTLPELAILHTYRRRTA